MACAQDSPTNVTPPNLSVVVPCHNKAPYLDVFLRSLTWSRLPTANYEVIVVDDGSTDEVASVVDRWRSQGIDVRLLPIVREPGLRNNAIARNVGWRAARYPLILQTDPDIVFVSDVLSSAHGHDAWLAPQVMEPQVLQHGARSEHVFGREVRRDGGGRVFLSCSGYYPLTRESTEALRQDPASGPLEYLEHAKGRPNQVLSPDGVGGLHGAFTVWRSDLASVGGYDESFRHWGWEDRALIVTLQDAGFTRVSMSDTPVAHQWHPSARGDTGREALASNGAISFIGLEIQAQRATAEYPRGRGPAAQIAIDAARMEAETLRSIGRVELSRQLLMSVLDAHPVPSHHVVEQVAAGAGPVQSPCVDGVKVTPEPTEPRVALVLRDLAECEDLLGDDRARDLTLGKVEAQPNGRALAAEMRARRALKQGDLPAASRWAADLQGDGWNAGRLALAVEIAILDGRLSDAAGLLSDATLLTNTGHLYEDMRLVEYARYLVGLTPSPRVHRDHLPGLAILGSRITALAAGPAGEDATEFVFSAAIRSQRDGLFLAAVLLFRRFLRAPGRCEARLLSAGAGEERRAAAHLDRLRRADPLRREGSTWTGHAATLTKSAAKDT